MILLYCTDSPASFDLISKLDDSGCSYEIHNDVEELVELGFKSLPTLVVDGKEYPYKKALKWLKKQR